ncbi:ATP synthase subunit alpha [Striga asiatica]|uniref:ATP synthase subunit alpha n=1 Tax=Striga asiatica TaxID=4170 RepID=A0A5A7PCW4_STRAF|nr:ATP synthase subunit alpha [Striga asiatica]
MASNVSIRASIHDLESKTSLVRSSFSVLPSVENEFFQWQNTLFMSQHLLPREKGKMGSLYFEQNFIHVIEKKPVLITSLKNDGLIIEQSESFLYELKTCSASEKGNGSFLVEFSSRINNLPSTNISSIKAFTLFLACCTIFSSTSGEVEEG